ncbi:hypothetical protein C8D90_106198 [Enterobacillus tribolii]|uniref:Uncharacterized protein n=1 Tax=Enterobacillus tribolii TaxID=1487935 RepID=A0A370QNS6_9GAMM|nr:hypothetical protein [Enterobacillus tribolii]RDK89992.1 hypothetical protein C8D90_106198 [Enterobacillus tribolii]
MGLDVSKKFIRWLDKLERDGLIVLNGEHITPLLQRDKVGGLNGRDVGAFCYEHGLQTSPKADDPISG